MTTQARAQKALDAIDLGMAFYGHSVQKEIEVGRYVGRALKIRAGILIFLPSASDLSKLDGKPKK